MNIHKRHRIYIILPKAIAALRIQTTAEGERLGVAVQLLKGAELRVCGSGYTPHTRRVESGGMFYFVFLQDLEDFRDDGDFVSRRAR